jgi:ketosteroid isomerase-like protein
MNYKLLMVLVLLGIQVNFAAIANDKKLIEKTLNDFHQAAADAEAKPYFSLLTDEAIFLGTDASERWTKTDFKAFVVPYFSKGRGWLYTPVQQNISILASKEVAFFDELLHSASYGTCRSSGVLVKTEHGWKISQYNLSIPMPNGLAKALVKQIKAFEQSTTVN